MTSNIHVLRPGGGPARPTGIEADRIGRLLELPRRDHCGHCVGMTTHARTVTIGCIVRRVCPECITNYVVKEVASA